MIWPARLAAIRGVLLRRSALAFLLALVPAVAPAATGTLTVLTATQRREVGTAVRPDGELVAIDDVVAGFGATITSDAKGGAATVQRGSHDLVLHHRKSLASVDGDLKLLSTPAQLEGGRWLVPVDSLPRLLGPLLERPVEWRPGQRVLVIGPVSIPRISVGTFLSGDMARVVFEASETVPFRVQQEQGRVTVAIQRDLVDVAAQPGRLTGGIVESVQFLGGKDNVFAVQLGPRFQKLKATEQERPARLVLELSGPAASRGADGAALLHRARRDPRRSRPCGRS
jgi:hypothetical protein